MAYKVVFESNAINDFEKAIEYHLKFSKAKAKRLEEEVGKAIKTLEHSPYFRVRYDNVRCLPLGKN